MKVSETYLCELIAKKAGISAVEKLKINMQQYPFKKGIRKIKAPNDAIIVDNQGNEFPYMIGNFRNDERLIDFDHIYVIRPKSLKKILKESGITIKSEFAKISEGGGWSSQGVRYFYEGFICEI